MKSEKELRDELKTANYVTITELARQVKMPYSTVYYYVVVHPVYSKHATVIRKRVRTSGVPTVFVWRWTGLKALVAAGKITEDAANRVLKYNQIGTKISEHLYEMDRVLAAQRVAKEENCAVITATQKHPPTPSRVITSSISEEKTAIRVCGEEIQSRGPVNRRTPLSKNWFNHLMTDVAVTFLDSGGHRDLGATYTRQQVRDIVAACLERVFSENTYTELKHVVRTPEHDPRTGEVIDLDKLD